MKNRFLRTLAAFLLLVVVHPAIGQNIKASAGGVVLDSQRALVVNAEVSIRNTATQVAYTTTTNASGRFRQPALDPGEYEIEVRKEGFSTYNSEPFRLNLGDSVSIDIELIVGTISDTLEVAAELDVLQVDDTKQSRSFDAEEMNDLPNQPGFAGRNFYTQALTTPGVNYSELAHRPFAVSGQRPRNNNYMVDSVQINDVESGFIAGRGVTEQVVSQEAVQGMEVLTHNYKAEYGRNSGSIVSLVSKSGSNELHGSGFWYHNNSALRARNFFEAEKANARTNLAGFTLGGPIKKNRTFIFGNLETYKVRGEDVSTFRTLTPDERSRANPLVQPLVDLYPESPNGSRIFSTGVPRESDQYSYLVRFDHNLTDSQSLMIRNNYTTNTSLLNNISGWVGHKLETVRTTQSITAHHTYAVTPTVVNELRAGYMRFTQFDEFIDPLAIGDPSVHGEIGFMIVPGLSNAGTIGFMGAQSALNVYSLSDDVSWLRGSHSLKAGSSLRLDQVNGGRLNNSFVGTIFFPNINAFLAAQPLSYSRVSGNPLIGLRRWELDAYLQDDWRISSDLVLNLGLRYELYTSPTEQHDRIAEQYRFPTDRNNFAPRIGLAWSGLNKTVVRAGWGVYFNALEMSFIGLTRFNPPNLTTVSAFRPQMPDLLAQAQESLPSGLVTPDPSSRTPFAQHFNLTIERELWHPASTLTAAYVGTIGTKLPRTRQPNGGDNWDQELRPDPTVGVVNRLETSGASNYHALQIGLEQQIKALTLKGAYTFSRFIDDVSEFATANTRLDGGILPLNESNLRLDRGLSDFHTPHMFTVSYIYDLPWMKQNRWLGNWKLSGITTLQSGRPFTLFSGTNNLTGAVNNRIVDVAGTLDRDPGGARAVALVDGLNSASQIDPAAGSLGTLGRNTEQGDSLLRWNLSLLKDLPLTEKLNAQFRAEMFNLFNTTNFNTIDNVLSVQRGDLGQATSFNPNFGRYTEAFDPRSLQLTLRLTF